MRTKTEVLDELLLDVERQHNAEPDPKKRDVWWEVIVLIQGRLRDAVRGRHAPLTGENPCTGFTR